MPMAAELPSPKNRRIVLCFDGTANHFTGDETDTNIVKIYEMLDRRDPHQFHYYQPGIGTYVQGSLSNSSTGNWFTSVKNSIIKTLDQGFGTSFVHHVLGGYSFLMRYYQAGDKIFIFGFSRGAYTARYLAEMIFNIGLLSRGNEEMVSFAWSTFSDFQRTREDDKSKAYMLRFKDTFCREHITVHFLGLFDCVNSVAQFQIPQFTGKVPIYMPMPPAVHIRHAVSIHERRLMFKPALFLLEPAAPTEGDVKEVWFTGNHGDVGGGWHCQGENYLLSDIPLRWMVEEVLSLPETENVLAWQKTKLDHMAHHEKGLESLLASRHILVKDNDNKKKSLRNLVHDLLSFGRGAGRLGVIAWWIMECLPFTYIDLVDGKWKPRSWPPNYGTRRDIAVDSTIHPSVAQLKRAGILRAKDMPRLGGEDPSVTLPKFNLFSMFKKKKEKKTTESREHLPEIGADNRIIDDGEHGSATHHTSNGTANAGADAIDN